MRVEDLKPGLRPIERAPKNATWIIVWTSRNGITANPTAVHWAQDLSGEEQPPYQGWFYDNGFGFNQFDMKHAIGWHPTAERAIEVAELKMTAFADRLPERDPWDGEQAILIYNEGSATWDLEFFESSWEFPDRWSGSHWLDISGMWPGVSAQVQSFGRDDNRDLERVLRECRRQFAFYVQSHRAKSPPDEAKAATNRKFVDMIDEAFPWLLDNDDVIGPDGSPVAA